MKTVLLLGAAAITIGLSLTPAAAVTRAQCVIAGKHLSNGHCCATGQNWNGGPGAGDQGGCCPEGQAWNSAQGCVAPGSGFGISLGIEDPRNKNFKTTPCKALGTC